MDFIFEIFCYTAATIAVLTLAGTRRTAPADIAAIAAEYIPPVEDPAPIPESAPVPVLAHFGSDRTTPDEAAIVESRLAPKTETLSMSEFDDLLKIPATPAMIDWRYANIRQLKAIASLYQVPRFNQLSKAKLLEVCSAA